MSAVPDTDSAVARLAATRSELRNIMWESRHGDEFDDQFPRSKTMRMLMSQQGAVAMAAMAGGVFLLKPRLMTYALRFIPVKMLMRMAAAKFFASRL